MSWKESRKNLIKTLKNFDDQVYYTTWYQFPIIQGRLASYSYVGEMPYSRLEECAKSAREAIINYIQNLDEDRYNGHVSASIPLLGNLTINFYLGGPGTSGPPWP